MITAYFDNTRDLRMPKQSCAPDPCGIRFHGPVLSGEITVREAFRRQYHQAYNSQASQLPFMGSGVKVPPPPSHQFPTEPDSFGRFVPTPPITYSHPDQYDPVLRYHLRMPPARGR